MPSIINTNIQSLNAQRNLTTSQMGLSPLRCNACPQACVSTARKTTPPDWALARE